MAQWLKHQTGDRKIVGSIPSRKDKIIFSPEFTFCAEY